MPLSELKTHLPNWDRFNQKYHPESEFEEAFFHRLSTIEDPYLLEHILKRINIELGILLLHDIEIDHETYAMILESIRHSPNTDH